MSDPSTKLAEVPVKWLGDSGKFDTQLKCCNAVRQLFDRQLRLASNAISALEANIKITPETLSGRCLACSNTGHQKAKCPKADKAVCTNCKKEGHYSNMCLFEFNAWRDSAETKKVSQEDEEHYESSASEENQ